MLLLRLKESSRLIFGTLHETETKIDKEMKKSDKVLLDVRRLESEISRIKRTTAFYKSFTYWYEWWIIKRTPEYDKVIKDADNPTFGESNDDKSQLDKQMEFLEGELTSRKRYSLVLFNKKIARTTGWTCSIQRAMSQNFNAIEASYSECSGSKNYKGWRSNHFYGCTIVGY